MSKQEVLTYWVEALRNGDCDEQKTIELISKYVSQSEAIEALQIYEYKPPDDTKHDIPNDWIANFVGFVKSYRNNPNPTTILQHFFNSILTFLDGADLVKLELALANFGGSFIEDYAAHFIKTHPVLDQVLDLNDNMNFPCARICRNNKFLYHLLYAYPNLATINSSYSNKYNRNSFDKRTNLSLYPHRQYITEKALKAGGLAFALNIFNKIVVNPSFRFPIAKKPKIIENDFNQLDAKALNKAELLNIIAGLEVPTYGGHSIGDNIRSLHIIPEFDEDLWFAFSYFTRSSEFMRYKTLTKFISAVRPKFSDYRWDELLTQHLGVVASRHYECIGILMDCGAKMNLSMKIRNNRTCNVIREACDSTNDANIIQSLIEMFSRAKGCDFEEESEKVNVYDVEMILDEINNFNLLQRLVTLLLKKKFVLTESAESKLKRLRF